MTAPSDPKTTEAQIASDMETITGGIAQAITIVSKVSTWTAICGFFTALPGLVNLILQFIEIFKTTPAESISDLSTALTQIVQAKTVEDRENAAKALASSINSLT